MLCLHRWQRLLGLKYARVLRSVVRKKSSRPNKIIGTLLLCCYILYVYIIINTYIVNCVVKENSPRNENSWDSGMCPGLGEWWLHKGVLNLRKLISMLKSCLGFLVDTLFCVKWLAFSFMVIF